MLVTNPLSIIVILEGDLGWGLNPGLETLGSQEHCRALGALAPRECWGLKDNPPPSRYMLPGACLLILGQESTLHRCSII